MTEIPIQSVPPATELAGATLLYDGTCGFCSKTIQFILKHERHNRSLRFATLQGPFAASLRDKYPVLNDTDSVVWYESPTPARKERLLVRSSAAIRVARYLGGIWSILGVLGWCIPRPLRDGLYKLVARNRYRIAGTNDSCLLPTPEQRARFLE
jgi:predicted DCC family thiol-disulfide oxidoreductase YuxK